MLYIDSLSQATRHGVYAIERNPPPVVQAQGASVCAIVEQFPWGPEGVYEVESVRDFIEKFAPGGMSRTGAGYMSVIGKAWPLLKVVRVLGSAAAAATATLSDSTPAPTNVLTLTLKYKGAAGNSVTWTVSNASDGDALHFNLEVSIVSSTGQTIDKFENLNYSGTGTDSAPSFTNAKLLGAITKLASGRPDNGTGSFSAGADGTVLGTDYVGTQGAADKGISLLEGHGDVDFVFTGDPGNSLRAAVNAGLKAHADYMTDRIAVINHNSAQAASAVRTDVASYRSLRCVYVDVWAYQRDDVDGTERLVAPAPFFASVAANLSPSTSPAWKSAEVRRLLGSITKLEAERGSSAYLNEQQGVVTLQTESNGGFSFECAVNTYKPLDPARGTYKRSRMGHYIAKAVVNSLREYIDSPNVAANQQDEINAVSEFLDTLAENAKTNPNRLPHILGYAMRPVAEFNPQNELDLGNFTIPADIKISSDQSKIFFSVQLGETVKIASVL